MNLEYDGLFKLIDSSTTHNRLLYRRFISEHQNFKENIDIEFSGVSFMQLPFLIDSPKLFKGEESDYIKLANNYKKELIPNKDKLFVISSESVQYFIVCNSNSFNVKDYEPEHLKSIILQNSKSKYRKVTSNQLNLFG